MTAPRRRFSLLLPLLLIWSSLETARGLPQFLLTSGKAKCYSVEVPKEIRLKIHYEAPDIDTDASQRGYSPTYITLLENPIETLEEQRLEQATDARSLAKRREQLNDLRNKKPRPVSQELTATKGSFVHTIHSEDATVDVCVRASKATVKSPMMFHLWVEDLDLEDDDKLDEFQKEKKKADNQIPKIGAEHHWSFMETQLDRIEHEVHTITKEADFFRERDALYHQQTDDLHKATLFWPMLHCGILIITGFTQANHIISFFKKRRII